MYALNNIVITVILMEQRQKGYLGSSPDQTLEHSQKRPRLDLSDGVCNLSRRLERLSSADVDPLLPSPAVQAIESWSDSQGSDEGGLQGLISPYSTHETDSVRSSSVGSENGSPPWRDTQATSLCDTPPVVADDLVCYGSLCGIRVQLDVHPDLVEVQVLDEYVSLDVKQRQELFSLQHQDQHVASLNLRVCKVFVQLQRFDLEYGAFIEKSSWIKRLRHWKKNSKNAAVLDADILVYGLAANAAEVGELLSQSRLFLQIPRKGQKHANISELNPHWFRINNEGQPSCETLDLEIEDRSKQLLSQRRAELFDCTPQISLLEEATIDPCVITILHPHQRIAVDFITKKEEGRLHSTVNMWQPEESRKHLSYFKHTIMGHTETRKPEEREGGILADDMGLGKTLTMLAAIVGTLQPSKLFQSQTRQNAVTPCSATLIIVPSVLVLDGWVQEIIDHIRPDTLNVYKYHGYAKEIDYAGLREKDIVLTTYATVESDARLKGHKFFPQYLWYRVILDEGKSNLSDVILGQIVRGKDGLPRRALNSSNIAC